MQPSMNKEQLKAFDCLLDFIYNGEHIKCLKLLRQGRRGPNKKALPDSTIQAILAEHLFAPLVPGHHYLIGSHFSKEEDERKCPGCKKKLKLGNTSYGNVNVWHGNADIVVGRSIVKLDEDKDAELNDGSGEPVRKKMKCRIESKGDDSGTESDDSIGGSNIVDVKIDKKIQSKQSQSQVLAQTIVNAFCEAKISKSVSELFIPSFLATESKVSIHMFCCSEDKLLTSQDLPIWSKSINEDKINISTLVCIWMALNFEKFENTCDLVPRIPKSKFKEIIENVSKYIYNVYSDNMVRPLIDEREDKEECQVQFFTEYSIEIERKIRTLGEGYKQKQAGKN